MATSVIPPRLCSDCSQALFGSGGVYCREFHEDIGDETVADGCGAFDLLSGAIEHTLSPSRLSLHGQSTPWSGPYPSDHHHVSPDPVLEPPRVVQLRPTTPVVAQDLERDQVLEGNLVVTFFGRTRQGDQLAEEVEATLHLHYPTSRVTWDYPKEGNHATPSV